MDKKNILELNKKEMNHDEGTAFLQRRNVGAFTGWALAMAFILFFLNVAKGAALFIEIPLVGLCGNTGRCFFSYTQRRKKADLFAVIFGIISCLVFLYIYNQQL